MDRSPNQNCVQHESRFSPRAKRERKRAIGRARRIMELSLEHVPNQQFEAWGRDKRAENEVLGPMPKHSMPLGETPRPSGLAPYLASLYDVPLLTREQELHLFRKLNYLKYKVIELRGRLNPLRPRKKLMARIEDLWQEIVATRNQIISANLRLVVSIARQHLGPMQNFFELISDGNVSLIRAVDRFDYSLGNRFSTYAMWAIINNFARTIAEGMRHRARFHTDHDGVCTAIPAAPDKHRALEAAQSHRQIVLDGMLRRLNDREREIIVCRYGLRRGDEPQTLQQVGDGMGVTRERIRQIEARALGKMRKAVMPDTLPGAMKSGGGNSVS